MVTLTWLGQAGFAFAASGVRLLVDPCLSSLDGRAYPPPADIESYLTGIDWLFITHEHADHMDIPLIDLLAETSPAARIAAPAPTMDSLASHISPDRLVSVAPGDALDLAHGSSVTVTPAIHALSPDRPFTDGDDGSGPRFVGYHFVFGDFSVYHAGDTLLSPEVCAMAAAHAPDLVLLPINGRDYYRSDLGLVGNIDAREAARFAAAVGARILLPMHWDMFSENSVRPATIVDEVLDVSDRLTVLIPARFQEIVIAA